MISSFFFFQAEDGIRDLVRSRGLGDVYKRQAGHEPEREPPERDESDQCDRTGDEREGDQQDAHQLSLIHI